MQEKPILNIKAHINRNSNDTRAQTNFIREVKKACLDFKSSQIKYKTSQFSQFDLVKINHDLLLSVQTILGQLGSYDKFFESHQGKQFYIKSINDYVVDAHTGVYFGRKKSVHEADIFIPSP